MHLYDTEGPARATPAEAGPERDAGGAVAPPGPGPSAVMPAIHFLGGIDAPQRHLCRVLRHLGHRVRSFADADGFRAALRNRAAGQGPGLVVVDEAMLDQPGLPRERFAELGIGPGTGIPFVVASERDDLAPRLAAFRAGAAGYLLKPLRAAGLSDAASSILGQQASPPYRVLLVDDVPPLVKLQAAILAEAGMQVRTLSEPMRLLEELDAFQPDVLVLDVFMPEAEGPELAAVLRQRERHRSLPILFLSSDTDLSRQLRALELGGDDFLVKPVEPAHLVAAVTARARRARQAKAVSARLRWLQYERNREHLALDRHALVSVTDHAGTIIHVNDRFCAVSGFTRAELIGQNHRMLKSGQHPPAFYQDFWRTIRSGEIWSGEICNRRKDGSLCWTECTIVPFFDDHDSPYQYVSIRTEITRVKQAEERLRISQNHANIGTWDWNIRTGELLCSERVGPLFGLAHGIERSSREAFLDAVHPDDRQAVLAAIDDCLSNGARYHAEYRCIWPDGTIRWLLGSGDVVRDGDGRPTHMLGIVQDITGLKDVEEALVSAKEDAEAANRAKSDFLSAMSHELRTPLNAILGFAQVLEIDAGLSEDQLDSVQTIRKSGAHLLRLINEVLDLARVESGRIDLSIEDIGIEDIFSACGKLIAPLAAARRIAVQFRRAAEAHAVRADGTRLRQVVLNLLSNAVKYNRAGGEITVSVAPAGDGWLRLVVRDTGHGIPSDRLGELFTAFNRLGAENSETEGTGIGLVISARLIEAMGGRIGADSKAGVGSTFWIELPEAALPSEAEPSAMLPGPGAQLPPGVVLYVEDNPANLKLVRHALSRYPQVTLLEAGSGQHGLELARARRPDLVLLDINMAGMDGTEVLARLRADPRTRSVPAVAISAAAMETDIERALAAGFRRYLTKPVDIRELLQVIADLLRQPDRRKAHDRRSAPAGFRRSGEASTEQGETP